MTSPRSAPRSRAASTWNPCSARCARAGSTASRSCPRARSSPPRRPERNTGCVPGVLSGMQPKLLLPLATAALLFGVPAAANAAVTATVVDATHATLTGDAADDNITPAVDAAGNITFAGAPIGKNDGTLVLTVNAGAGNDTINLAGVDLANSPVNGEAGDDIITGGDNADAIDGGDGNDRITGFRGN